MLFDESQEEELAAKKKSGEDFEDVKPLAEELIDTLIDMLFLADFTVPRPQNSKNKITYAIWQSGVGCNTSIASTKEFESNRCEILRLLLALTSQSMYIPANLLPVQGVRAITYIASCPDKQVVLSLLCSLLNTVSLTSQPERLEKLIITKALKYNPVSWRVPYNPLALKEPKEALVTYSLQVSRCYAMAQ